MTETRIPTHIPGFTLQHLDDEVLLYHAGLTRTVHLNPTAALIWQLCSGDRTALEITQLLADAYPEGGHDVAADVAAALDQLAKDGVVEWR